MLLDRRLRIPLCVGAVFALSGCPNPNVYTVPRTIDPGTVQVSVAPEFYGVSFKQADGTTASAVVPTFPTVGVRVGIVPNFELGARAPNFDSLAIDGKVLLLKGAFDLAIDPGVQSIFLSTDSGSAGIFHLHLPVILGLNLSDKLTLVLTPGVMYSAVTATVVTTNTAQQGGTASGLFGRLGLGVDVRIGRRFALHPEFTVMRGFDSTETLLFVGGIGFNFGHLPDYSDLGGGAAAKSE